MRSTKKALAALLATLQFLWSLSGGAYEALAQSHAAPARVSVSVPMVSASAVVGFTALGHSLPVSPISLTPSLIPTLVSAPVRAAVPPARLAAVERASKSPGLQASRRDAPTEGASQEGAQAFAEVYGETLIKGEASEPSGTVQASAAPSASASLRAAALAVAKQRPPPRPGRADAACELLAEARGSHGSGRRHRGVHRRPLSRDDGNRHTGALGIPGYGSSAGPGAKNTSPAHSGRWPSPARSCGSRRPRFSRCLHRTGLKPTLACRQRCGRDRKPGHPLQLNSYKKTPKPFAPRP